MNGIQVETCEDVNGGENVGYTDAGDWIEYTINIPTTGIYTVNSRVASDPGNAAFQFQVNGQVLGTTNIGATGGWQSWTTLSTNINLSAGTQTLRLLAVAGGWNINWLEINSQSAKSDVTKTNLVKEITMFPNPVKEKLNINLLNYTEAATIDIVDVKGQVVVRNKSIEGNVLTIDTSNLSNGLYLVRVKSLDKIIMGVKKFVK